MFESACACAAVQPNVLCMYEKWLNTAILQLYLSSAEMHVSREVEELKDLLNEVVTIFPALYTSVSSTPCTWIAMVTITLVVGCVLEIQPTSVRPVPFCRDILFLIMTNLMVLAATSVGAISVSAGSVPLAGLWPWRTEVRTARLVFIFCFQQ